MQKRPLRNQLGGRGSAGRAVRVWKEKTDCRYWYERPLGRCIDTGVDSDRSVKLRCSDKRWCTPRRAVAEAAALRFLVTGRRMTRMVRHVVRHMRVGMTTGLDRESAMHFAQVQLHRLGEADA